MVSWGPIRMGTRKGLHMRICFWSIPGGSSSSCFCCDSLLDQRPLVRSTRALSKLVQCLFLLFLSFLFSLFLPSLWSPPILSIPHPQPHFIWPPSWHARGARTAASSCCFCCCPLVRFLVLFFFADIPL